MWFVLQSTISSYPLSCTRLRILLHTICRKPGFNSPRTPLNHGAEQASNETLKQTQQRNWSNASQGGQTALKEHFAVLHYETASTKQQPRDEHRGTIKDCKIAGATTWQGQGNHTFTTNVKINFLSELTFPAFLRCGTFKACYWSMASTQISFLHVYDLPIVYRFRRASSVW